MNRFSITRHLHFSRDNKRSLDLCVFINDAIGERIKKKRVTTELATRRNVLVAALADEACFAHITPGGQSDRLTIQLTKWHIPFSTLEND